MKSKQYFDYYKNINASKDKYEDYLTQYEALLNYFSENFHNNNEIDTLNMNEINIKDNQIINNNIPIMKGNNMIPVDIDIKINNE